MSRSTKQMWLIVRVTQDRPMDRETPILVFIDEDAADAWMTRADNATSPKEYRELDPDWEDWSSYEKRPIKRGD